MAASLGRVQARVNRALLAGACLTRKRSWFEQVAPIAAGLRGAEAGASVRMGR